MDIIIFVSNDCYHSLGNNIHEIGRKVGMVSAELSANSNEKTNVKILEGMVPDNLHKNKIVAIYIRPDYTSSGAGKAIPIFKQRVIEIFDKYGFDGLNKDNLFIQLNPRLDTKQIIENHAKVMNNSYKDTADDDVSKEYDYELKAKMYHPTDPLYSFDRVILPEKLVDKIKEAVGIVECENKVFKEWGLYEIQPHPSTALSFYGPSGTGKTMAAEAVAKQLGKKILKVSYADVESKYHGEGPKMVKAIFLAAKNADAVLFFDEADSLLSKRLTNVTQGSEQAINSMRSQLLICLEEYRGIVIFATNLIVNYDPAFLTRLISIEFSKPDVETRRKIWDVHIKAPDDGKPHMLNIPLSDDVNTTELAKRYNFVGREIRNAVVSACVTVALSNRENVTQNDFINACEKIKDEKESLSNAKHDELSDRNDLIKKALENKIQEKENKNVS